MVRRGDDEGRGSVLVFDRYSLERQYELKPNPEVFWHSETLFHDEAEEEIWESVTNIHHHLIGVVSGPSARRSQEHKTLNRQCRLIIEALLRKLDEDDSLLAFAKSSHRFEMQKVRKMIPAKVKR